MVSWGFNINDAYTELALDFGQLSTGINEVYINGGFSIIMYYWWLFLKKGEHFHALIFADTVHFPNIN